LSAFGPLSLAIAWGAGLILLRFVRAPLGSGRR
jgi:hypothetical protein